MRLLNSTDKIPIFDTILLIIFLIFLLKDCDSKADCNDDPNLKQIKQLNKEIQTIYVHPEYSYTRLHNDEREQIKKKLPEQPNLRIFLE